MTNHDGDRLLESLLAAPTPLADDGDFAARVMDALPPARAPRRARYFVAFGVGLASLALLVVGHTEVAFVLGQMAELLDALVSLGTGSATAGLPGPITWLVGGAALLLSVAGTIAAARAGGD